MKRLFGAALMVMSVFANTIIGSAKACDIPFDACTVTESSFMELLGAGSEAVCEKYDNIIKV